MYNGYNFYFKIEDVDLLTFPITPPELTIKSGSNNEVVNLINGGDINILKSPSLTEIEFEARFPMRQYPYAREFQSFQTYFDIFKKLKHEKLPFTFVVSRRTNDGIPTWGTEYMVSLEDLELNESADEGDDVLLYFKLKQYKPYSVITIQRIQPEPDSNEKEDTATTKPTTTTTTTTTRPTTNGTTNKKYTVKRGDCLWNISKKFYGKGSLWKKIYNANKSTIEKAAKKHGRKSSSNGHWIYPGTVLVIPKK